MLAALRGLGVPRRATEQQAGRILGRNDGAHLGASDDLAVEDDPGVDAVVLDDKMVQLASDQGGRAFGCSVGRRGLEDLGDEVGVSGAGIDAAPVAQAPLLGDVGAVLVVLVEERHAVAEIGAHECELQSEALLANEREELGSTELHQRVDAVESEERRGAKGRRFIGLHHFEIRFG